MRQYKAVQNKNSRRRRLPNVKGKLLLKGIWGGGGLKVKAVQEKNSGEEEYVRKAAGEEKLKRRKLNNWRRSV